VKEILATSLVKMREEMHRSQGGTEPMAEVEDTTRQAWYQSYPSPIPDIWSAAAEGTPSIIIEGNTNDRILDAKVGLPPLSVENAIFFVAARHGYRCAEFSLTRGFSPVTAPDVPPQGQPWATVNGDPNANLPGYLAAILATLRERDSQRMIIMSGGMQYSPIWGIENSPTPPTKEGKRWSLH
jgi:hypothetical protein